MSQKCLLLLFTVILLSGCKEDLNANYLEQHPLELKKAVNTCQAALNQSSAEKAQCDQVMSAANRFTALLDAMQRNPEQFGQEVITIEMTNQTMAMKLAAEKQRIVTLEQQPAQAMNELQTAKDNMLHLEKNLDQQQHELNTMMAVIALTSPE